MSRTTKTFTSTLTAPDALKQFTDLAGREGWKIKDSDERSVRASTGVNARTWITNIELTATPGTTGADVELLVSSPVTPFDYGIGKKIAKKVSAELGATG